jgi:hypothetical protein
MKRAVLSLFICGGAILSANTVSVKFVSANPVVTVPGEGGDAGPYTLNVNGQSVLGMCMDDFLNVSNNTWTANVTAVNSSNLSNTILGNQTVSYNGHTLTSSQTYEMEAYLFSEIIQPNADRGDLQLAAWALMDSDTMYDVFHDHHSYDTTAQNDLAGAYDTILNPHSGFNPGNYEILTDTVKYGSQEFIVASPEPSTCLLLGSGLLLAGIMRFRRKGAVASN